MHSLPVFLDVLVHRVEEWYRKIDTGREWSPVLLWDYHEAIALWLLVCLEIWPPTQWHEQPPHSDHNAEEEAEDTPDDGDVVAADIHLPRRLAPIDDRQLLLHDGVEAVDKGNGPCNEEAEEDGSGKCFLPLLRWANQQKEWHFLPFWMPAIQFRPCLIWCCQGYLLKREANQYC